ncbi:MAG: hypothetical protein QOI40_5442, partial [Alphaproteobacteria bacterium]|nr:hypothetical protein [Alphaproteobacteria bacterium]
LTSDEWADRIIQSLKDNSADFKKQRRAQRNAKVRRILVVSLIFAAGLGVGVLLKAAL